MTLGVGRGGGSTSNSTPGVCLISCEQGKLRHKVRWSQKILHSHKLRLHEDKQGLNLLLESIFYRAISALGTYSDFWFHVENPKRQIIWLSELNPRLHKTNQFASSAPSKVTIRFCKLVDVSLMICLGLERSLWAYKYKEKFVNKRYIHSQANRCCCVELWVIVPNGQANANAKNLVARRSLLNVCCAFKILDNRRDQPGRLASSWGEKILIRARMEKNINQEPIPFFKTWLLM